MLGIQNLIRDFPAAIVNRAAELGILFDLPHDVFRGADPAASAR
jgi:hypothetical protein